MGIGHGLRGDDTGIDNKEVGRAKHFAVDIHDGVRAARADSRRSDPVVGVHLRVVVGVDKGLQGGGAIWGDLDETRD
ncbi:hypothetical protein FRC17_010228, partial [Serendipita sp. 399]